MDYSAAASRPQLRSTRLALNDWRAGEGGVRALGLLVFSGRLSRRLLGALFSFGVLFRSLWHAFSSAYHLSARGSRVGSQPDGRKASGMRGFVQRRGDYAEHRGFEGTVFRPAEQLA